MWHDALLLLVAYLLGSVPFAYGVLRLAKGIDPRTAGNGNVGTRNVIRLAGLRWGLVVLLLDGLKGAAAYGLIAHWGTPWLVWLGPLALWAGHCFPIWLGGRGGVGQAAITGYLAAMWPPAALVAVPVFLVARRLLPWFNVAYALAYAVALGVTYLQGNSWLGILWMIALMGLLIAKKLLDGPRQRRLLAMERTAPEEHSDIDSIQP